MYISTSLNRDAFWNIQHARTENAKTEDKNVDPNVTDSSNHL